MKYKCLIIASLILTACTKEPNVAVRIDCGDYNDKGLQATLNGQPVGDCPVDVMVHAGEVNVSARKENEDASYFFGEAKMTLAENAMKRIKLDIQPVYTEEYYYLRATDITGMHAYLEKQPDGKRGAEVSDKLEQYYFDQATDIAGMQAYLEKQPNGKRRSEITDKLEKHYFNKATDLAGMRAYLEKQPNGKRKSEIAQRLKTELAKLDNFAPGLVMVQIPAGSFMMGCSEGDSDCSSYQKPRHQVKVPAFALSKTEVTFAQYDMFAKATKRGLPKDEGWGRGNRPVINVSWNDAQAYVKWLSMRTGKQFRLPSEAEWEYAARAGSTSKYSWGNSLVKNSANCWNCGSRWDDKTAPVTSFAANTFGLHDMHGNVREFTQDCWNESYNNAPNNGTAWLSGDCTLRVYRGGSWSGSADQLIASDRFWLIGLNVRSSTDGFRVAHDLPQ